MADIEYTTQKGHRIVIHDDGKIDVMGAPESEAQKNAGLDLGPGSDENRGIRKTKPAPSMEELRAEHDAVANNATVPHFPMPGYEHESLEKGLGHEDPIGTAIALPAALSGLATGTLGQVIAKGAIGGAGQAIASNDNPRQIVESTAVGAAIPLLAHGAGKVVGAAGRAMENTEGGRAAKFLAERGEPRTVPKTFGEPKPTVFDPEHEVVGGTFEGETAGEAIKRLEQIKQARPSMASDLDEEIGRIRAEASKEAGADPDVVRARAALKFHGPHGVDAGAAGLGLYMLHGGHTALAGLPTLLTAAARNASPLAGRLAAPTVRLGNAMAAPISQAPPIMNPLLQAVMGESR